MGSPSVENFDARRVELINKVSLAKQSAIPEEEVQAYIIEQNQLTLLREKNEISSDEYQRRFKDISKEPYVVDTYNLPEFSHALRVAGYKPQVIREILVHENAHANKAESLGVKECWYRIIFSTRKIGERIQVGILPMEVHVMPSGLTKEESFVINREITSAPDELSDLDVGHLKQRDT